MKRRDLCAIAAVYALCSLGLSILHQRTRPHYRLSARAAIADARAYPADRRFLAHHATTGARVIPLDARLQRVTFFDGAQVVLDAAVGASSPAGEHGEVRATEQHVAGAPASGAALANSPWILGLLSALFLLATLVVPLQRVRNLDALALAATTLTVPLVNDRLLAASVVCAYPLLGYLTLRCLAVGLRRDRTPAPEPSTPLLSHLCAGWEPRRRIALLRKLVAATVLAFAMITLSSAGYTDVAAASLQGATDLLHGVLPYGHIDVALHGDTYPLLNYALYIPGALWHPVSNVFSDLSGSLAVALAASLIAGAAMWRVAGSSQIAPADDRQRAERRLRAALAWFAFPPVLLAASGGANDLLLAACLAWMLALRPRAGSSLLMLAMGAWVKLVPLVLAPIWIAGRRRELTRALLAPAALSLALAGTLVALGGVGGVSAMIGAISFQFQRGSFAAPWYAFDVTWLQPFAQAAVVAVLLAAVLRLRGDASARGDLVRMSALAAALLLGVQLAANYWTWSYLPWALPLLLIALLTAEARDADTPAGQVRDRLRAAARRRAPRGSPGRSQSPSAVG